MPKIEYPLVSIVTSCYNDGSYIEECVKSVSNSSYPNIEHIIIDDGSDKETLDVLHQIDNSNIRIIYQQNSGVCVARNNAIKEANGKYLLFLDADDKISSNYILDAVTKFEKNVDARVVSSLKYKCFGEVNEEFLCEPFEMGVLLAHNLFPIFSMCFLEDAKSIGGFDERFNQGLEDWDFWISILKIGGGVEYVDGVNAYYRIKRKHRNSSLGGIKGINELRKKIWNKHKELFSIYYVDPMMTYECMHYEKLSKIGCWRKFKSYIKSKISD